MGPIAARLLALFMGGMLVTGCEPHRASPSERVCHLQIAAPLHEAMLVQDRQARGPDCGSVDTIHGGDISVLNLGQGLGSCGFSCGPGDPRLVLVIIVCILAVVIVVAVVTAVVRSCHSSGSLPSDDYSVWQLRCLGGGGDDGAIRSCHPLRLARDGSVRLPTAWWPILRQGTFRYELSLRAQPSWSLPVVGVLRGDALLLGLPAAPR